jgi:hypothetical protein
LFNKEAAVTSHPSARYAAKKETKTKKERKKKTGQKAVTPK